MENAKDKSSRSGSKSDLNESSLPLLDSEDVDLKGEGKVIIEMVDTNKGADDACKDESNKEADADGKDAGKDEKCSKKKEKKKKEKKEKKENNKEPKSPNRAASFTERLTAGLNLLDRDDRNVNDHVNIVFEDVLAEPDSNHGFDGIWRLTSLIFSGSKLWVYRVLSALLAIPCGLMWGIIFSLLTLFNVWVVSPLLCTFRILMHITHKIWATIIQTFLDPIFQSVGKICSSVTINRTSVHHEIVKEP